MSLILIIIQFILSILALFKDEFIKSQKIKKVFIVIALILMIVGSIFQIKLQIDENFNNQYDGVLTSPTYPLGSIRTLKLHLLFTA